jgi:phospholipase C
LPRPVSRPPIYFSDVPFLVLWGSKYVSISKPYEQFLADCATGALPNVAYVDPRFLGEDQGASNDDHPHADIRVGERFLNDIYEAVTSSPAWSSTLLVITYDEWGGFFDHVAPALAPDVNPSFERRGFRVPTLLISPFARRNRIDQGVYDHTSLLRLIEWRWNLAPLSVRDAKAANLGQALDFSAPKTAAPRFTVPDVVGVPCPPVTLQGGEESEWNELATVARASSWSIR